MIQLSALPTVPGTATMAEILGNGGADAGNFGALLAVQLSIEPVLPTPATAAIPALALPDSGNKLPPAELEVLAPDLANAVLAQVIAVPDIESDPAPVSGAVNIAAKPTPLTLPCAVVAKARAKPNDRSDPAPGAKRNALVAETAPLTQADAPLQLTPTQLSPTQLASAQPGPLPQDLVTIEMAPPTPVPLASALPSALQSPVKPELAPATLIINAPVTPLIQPVLSRAEPSQAAGQTSAPRTARPREQPPVQTRPATSPASAPPSPLTAPVLPVPPISLVAALHAAPIAAELTNTTAPLTRPATPLRLRAVSAASPAQSLAAASAMLTGKPGDAPALVFEPLQGKPALSGNGQPLTAGTTSPLIAPQPGEPASAASALASARPLDFAGLVDRLVQARDAAAPQSVSLALTHAEFGKISLRFEHDATGLSVGMTSPDPDFARAVSAAIPAERPASADQQQGSGTGQSSRHDASGSDPSGQPRGGPNPERRDERGSPRPKPNQSSHHQAEKRGRGDIFA